MSNSRVITKDYVYAEIKDKIISGSLQPDENIVEENLAREFDVSRTPLRSALQQLEYEELLVRKPNGRLKVAPISVSEARDIFNVRSLLEGYVARDAAKHATEKDKLYLKHLVRMLQESSEQGAETEQVKYGMQFHAYLYEISGNRTAAKILNLLNDRINRYRRLGLLGRSERIEGKKDDHALILDYIVNGDEKNAEHAAQQHVNRSMEKAVERIRTFI
ncbi:GntR family transcriptional regulator [Virgibacillus siamensis]|uniref:GntR family transcriptional regulator n=1 Tax=Virgibacillus siamensis TaxID=480071 RepID=UPI0009871445|nr:GntR family transcriptional regulator [Virgibacillus siamensis]